MKKLIKKKFVVYFKDGSKYYSPWLSVTDEYYIKELNLLIVYKMRVIEKIDNEVYPRYKSYTYRFVME